MLLRVLVATDPAALSRRVRALLDEGDAMIRVLPGRARWRDIMDTPCDVLVATPSAVPPPVSEHVAELADQPNPPAVILLAEGTGTEEHALLRAAGVEAVLDGALPDETLRGALRTILATRRQLLARALAARRVMARPQLSDFVSSSTAMQRLMRVVRRVVDSDAPMLVTGETGVGKERLARAVHGASRRSDGPFISVNCGAIPENLLESQLFGHERGAFTGATKAQRGCFELAHGGVLFLDEICEMPFHLQVKLLHVLQDYEIRPVGADHAIAVDVRVIAATNRDIVEEIAEKRFRRDLYYRLSVVTVNVPSLRERRSDIPDLAHSFVEDLSVRIGRKVTGLSADALVLLCQYPWPGNVREMINVLERAILLCEGDAITVADLPEEIARLAQPSQEAVPALSPGQPVTVSGEWLSRPLREVREAFAGECEKAYLRALLQETRGRIGETAQRAGIEPRSLFSKMKRHGLKKEDFKAQTR